MPRYKMIVLSNPVEGREAEYNDWYQNIHLAQVISIKGFQSAQRFRLTTSLVEGEVKPYLAIYEIETNDVESVIQDLRKLAEAGSLLVSDTLDIEHVHAAVYEELGPAVAKL